MKRLIVMCLALALAFAPAAEAAKGKSKSGKAAAASCATAKKSKKSAKKSLKAKASAKKGKKGKKAKAAKCAKKTTKAAKKGPGTPDAIAAAVECRADRRGDPEGFAADFGDGSDAVDACIAELLAIAAGDDEEGDTEEVAPGDVVDDSEPAADEPNEESGFIEDGEGEDVPLI